MARLPERERAERDAKILADWKAGYSQNQLAKNYDVSPATVNKICKGVEQNNKEIVNTQVAINTELVNKSEYEVNAIHKAVDEQTRRANLVYGVTESALNQLRKISDDGVKEVLVKTKLGNDIIVEKETINLTPSDYESIISATDKASLTLGVNQRHAPKIDVTQMQAVQASGTTKIEIIEDRKVSNG